MPKMKKRPMRKKSDVIPATVVEVLNTTTVVPFPNSELHEGRENKPQEDIIVSAQSVVVDAKNRLWIMDTGAIAQGSISQGGPKLIAVDLNTNQVVKKIVFKINEGGVLDTTFLNDIRFDLSRGKEGVAFISDSSFTGPPGIIVVDLASEDSWRFLSNDESTIAQVGLLPVIEVQTFLFKSPDGTTSENEVGVDGIAISPDGSKIFYCPLTSRKLYQVSADLLANKSATNEDVKQTVVDLGERGGIADGLESDSEGNVYVTNLEHNAVLKRVASTGEYETVISVPELLWPDTLSVAADGFLYVTAGQLHRLPAFNKGVDLRVKPFSVWKVYIGSKPVVLK
eukprot:TRINITY_DN34200_c0_g1_i12.p1 TRINITY_DN34200_c0_g1~~TRINITY_DN34200_c0_g1_i12.p1  ORF type:complete len:340 (-),score=41.27 TRINITY_DN34200_c0_g1_i12:116-1135(-)